MPDTPNTPSRQTLARRAKRPSVYEDEVSAAVEAAAAESAPKTPRRRAAPAAKRVATPKTAAASRTPRTRKAHIDAVVEQEPDLEVAAPSTPTSRKRAAAIDDTDVPKKVSRTPGKKRVMLGVIEIPDTPVLAPLLMHPDAKPSIGGKTPRKSRAGSMLETIYIPDTPTPATVTAKTPRKSRAAAASAAAVAEPPKTDNAKTPRKRATSLATAAPKTPSTRSTRKRVTRAELESKSVPEEDETVDDVDVVNDVALSKEAGTTDVVIANDSETADPKKTADDSKIVAEELRSNDEELTQPLQTEAATDANEVVPLVDTAVVADDVDRQVNAGATVVAEADDNTIDVALSDEARVDNVDATEATPVEAEVLVADLDAVPTLSPSELSAVAMDAPVESAVSSMVDQVADNTDGNADTASLEAEVASVQPMSQSLEQAKIQSAAVPMDEPECSDSREIVPETPPQTPALADVSIIFSPQFEVNAISAVEVIANAACDSVPESASETTSSFVPPSSVDNAQSVDSPLAAALSETTGLAGATPNQMAEGESDDAVEATATTDVVTPSAADLPATTGQNDENDPATSSSLAEPIGSTECDKANTLSTTESATTGGSSRTSVDLSVTFEKIDDAAEESTPVLSNTFDKSANESVTSVGLSNTFDKPAEDVGTDVPAAPATVVANVADTETLTVVQAPDTNAMGSIDLTAADNSTFDSHAATTAANAADAASPVKPRPVPAAVPTIIVIPDTPAVTGRPLDTTFSPEPSSPPRANSTTRKVAAAGRLMQTPRAVAALKQPLKGIRKRSFSVDASPAGGRAAINKSVIFHSPSNQHMPIDQIDLLMEASRRDLSTVAGGKENFAVPPRRKRSLSMVEADRRGMYRQRATPVKRPAAADGNNASGNGGAPTPKKTRIPDFQSIHQRNFDRMESIADYKNRLASSGVKIVARARIVKPVARGVHSAAENKTRTLAAIQANVVKPVCFKSKLPTSLTAATAAAATTTTTAALTSRAVATTTATTITAAWQPPKMTVPPSFAFGSSISSSTTTTSNSSSNNNAAPAISRLAERQAKHRALAKGQLAAGASAAAGANKPADVKERQSQMLRGVRSNRRFELQMKFRQQNDD